MNIYRRSAFKRCYYHNINGTDEWTLGQTNERMPHKVINLPRNYYSIPHRTAHIHTHKTNNKLEKQTKWANEWNSSPRNLDAETKNKTGVLFGQAWTFSCFNILKLLWNENAYECHYCGYFERERVLRKGLFKGGFLILVQTHNDKK